MQHGSVLIHSRYSGSFLPFPFEERIYSNHWLSVPIFQATITRKTAAARPKNTSPMMTHIYQPPSSWAFSELIAATSAGSTGAAISFTGSCLT